MSEDHWKRSEAISSGMSYDYNMEDHCEDLQVGGDEAISAMLMLFLISGLLITFISLYLKTIFSIFHC